MAWAESRLGAHPSGERKSRRFMVATEAESDSVPVTTNPCPRFFPTMSWGWLSPLLPSLPRQDPLFVFFSHVTRGAGPRLGRGLLGAPALRPLRAPGPDGLFWVPSVFAGVASLPALSLCLMLLVGIISLRCVNR